MPDAASAEPDAFPGVRLDQVAAVVVKNCPASAKLGMLGDEIRNEGILDIFAFEALLASVG